MRLPRPSRPRRRATLLGVLLGVGLAPGSSLTAQASALSPGDAEGAWPRRVLITNDDGIDAEPLRALARAFAVVAETWVAAPTGNRSGSSSYLSALSTGRLEVRRRELGAGIAAYAVDGYPGDAVAFALLGPMRDRPPDLVISGINGGSNLGGAWFLSGTVGAARVAAFLGVPALAVSGVEGESPEAVRAVAEWVVALAGSAPVRGLEPREYLAVSLPVRDPRFIRGVEIVRHADGFLRFEADPVGVEGGEGRRREAGEPEGREPEAGGAEDVGAGGREVWTLSLTAAESERAEGTDVGAVAEGHIAVVPMRVGEEDGALRKRLEALADSLPAWPAP